MSWANKASSLRKVEMLIQNKTMTFEQLIKEDSFLNGLNQNSIIITDFVILNLKKLIEMVVGKIKIPEETNSRVLTMALLCHNSKIDLSLTRKPEYINFIIDLIDININLSKLFRILQDIIENSNGEVLFLISKSKLFYEKLISLIHDSSTYQFLIYLFNRRSSETIRWLLNISIETLLIENLYNEEKIIVKSLQLLLQILNNTETNKLILKISNILNFKIIFNVGIDSPTIQISDLSFKILYNILLKCSNDKNNNEISEFDQIMDFLELNYNKICYLIKKDEEFYNDKKSACQLLQLLMTSLSEFNEDLLNTINFLWELFKKFKTNSFLHLSFLNLFVIILNNLKYEDFIIKFIEDLIKEFKNTLSSNKGFLIEISYKINEKIKKNISNEWNNFINNIILPLKEKWNKNYGGNLPKENENLIIKHEDSFEFLTNQLISILNEEEEEEEGFLYDNEEDFEEDKESFIDID